MDAGERQSIDRAIKLHIQLYQDKESQIEQFKSQIAILRNSESYFPVSVNSLLQNQTIDPTLAALLNKLLQDVLLFNLTTSQELKPQIEGTISQILAVSRPIAQRADVERAIAHARIILTRRPQGDRLVNHILSLPTGDRGEDIAQTYYNAYQQALDTASLNRLALYLLSTLLVIGIATSIIWKLRTSAIAVQQSEVKLRAIFENSLFGIFRVRLEDGLILAANQRCANMLGHESPAEIVGHKRTTDFYVDLSQRQSILEIVQQQGEINNFEQQVRRQDGTTFWGLFSARLNVVEGCLEGAIADISDRKAAEAALAQAKEAAEVANDAKTQFLSHMSHELRTPLSVILGFTQLLTRSNQLDPKQQEYLDTISRSGEHLLALINDVLEMSKIEADRITLNEQDFNLHHLLDGLQQMFQLRATSKGLEFIVERSPDLPECIRTDESKLRQVLVNLIGNAIKFTQAGSVTLRVSLGSRESGVGSREQGGQGGQGGQGRQGSNSSHQPLATSHSFSLLTFSVTDTGVGIAPAEVDRLFDPFVQAEAGISSQEGTGLGLPISRKFVQLMGGNITVESRLGEGSCFEFYIQAENIAADVIPSPTTSRQVIGLAAGQPAYRILIVEDKPSNRQLLLELLQPVGFDVREAENGREAIAIWQSWQPHLIWMDLRMPVMDGYAATKQIKSAPDAPIIIVLTGSAFEEERQIAVATGCDDFIRKPFRAEVLFEKMTEYLGVQYIYKEEEGRKAIDSTRNLHASSLQVMPVEWIEQLRQAAICVNAKLLHQLIAQIPPSHASLAQSIAHLVDNFQFEEIVNLTSAF
ncbi:response regulator [Chroococcidiopsis sp. FACHB-1243]|nr:response regulator [Chroococcidiopsis sp. [FACHB-1243]]